MTRARFLVVVATLVIVLTTLDVWAGGRGGGGGARPGGSGGGGRAGGAASTPSMSRSASKPAVASKSPVASRPSSGAKPGPATAAAGGQAGTGNRPSVSDNRPKVTADRPKVGTDGPKVTADRPKVGTDGPKVGGDRPGPNTGAVADRVSGKRPSEGELNDFLDLPGKPDGGDRPNLADRPNLDDRPEAGDRTKISERVDDRDRTQIGDRTTVGDVNVNVGNQVAVNREQNINSMRNKWTSVDQRPFDRDWWDGRDYLRTDPHWHWQAGWSTYPAHWCWRPCTWAACGTWFAWAAVNPVRYNYGTNVVYRDNYVYIDNQQVATTEVYYQQAETLAQSTPADVNAEKVEWMPLGVFAITEQDATDSGMTVQLAVSKEGILAGTFHNDITDSSRPVEGMVDRESQRAAWKFADGKNPEIVMETVLSNLTEDEATALVHFGAEKTQTWLMVRLPAPAGEN